MDDDFREREALAGRFLTREQRYEAKVLDLPDERRRDLVELYAQLGFAAEAGYPIVHDTGVGFPDRDGSVQTPQLVLDDVHRLVGRLPALLEPSPGLETLVDAYDRWILRWRQAARQALHTWVHDDGFTESAGPNDPRIASVRLIGPDDRASDDRIDARDDFELFLRVRAAAIRLDLLADAVDDESLSHGVDIVGTRVRLLPHTTRAQIVTSYEDRVRRIEQIALNHFYVHADTEQAFVRRMRIWASHFGSERLRIGLADGYRMTATYIQERLAVEAPGFHAFRSKQPHDLIGKERTAPSENALRLRRAVQAWLDEHARAEDRSYEAVIRWIDLTDTPDQLVDDEPDDDRNAEAIVVSGWLNRYQLVGIVDGPERPAWVSRTLAASDYGLAAPSQREPLQAPAPADDFPF